MKIQHEGRTHTTDVMTWTSTRLAATPEMRAEMDRAVTEGQLTADSGAPLTEKVAERFKARLLGTYAHLPPTTQFSPHRDGATRPRDWLVEGVWRRGTIPMLGGNPKAGKTTMVADLIASILQPDREFLGRFPTAHLDEGIDPDESDRYVLLINAETPRDALAGELAAQGLADSNDLSVEHLEDLGGAHQFDVTDPSVYALWENRLGECYFCDPDTWVSPHVVIVDGLTAILNAAGKDTEHYGRWYAAFKRLMAAADVPNALVVGHNTLTGGHLMGGVEAQANADGLWSYYSSKPDDPTSARYFKVVPRMGGDPLPPTRVTRDEDGRLTATSGDASRLNGTEEVRTPTPREIGPEIMAYVQAANLEGDGPTARELRENVSGPNREVDRTRDELVESGLLTERQRPGRGGGKSFWVTSDE